MQMNVLGGIFVSILTLDLFVPQPRAQTNDERFWTQSGLQIAPDEAPSDVRTGPPVIMPWQIEGSGGCSPYRVREAPGFWCNHPAPPFATTYQDLLEAGYSEISTVSRFGDDGTTEHSVLMAHASLDLVALPRYSCLIIADFNDPDAATFNMCKRLK